MYTWYIGEKIRSLEPDPHGVTAGRVRSLSAQGVEGTSASARASSAFMYPIV